MTSPVYPAAAAGSTPNFSIKFLAQGAPAHYTRAILEDAARTIDAALTRGGVAPPAAQDLVAEAGTRANADTALGGRITVLEGRQTKVLQWAEAVPNGGWSLWGDASYPRMSFTLQRNGMCTIAGGMGTPASGTPPMKVCGFPTPPAGSGASYVPKASSQGGSSIQIVPAMINETARFAEVRPDGLYIRGAAVAANAYIFLCVTYPTATVAAG